MSKAAWPTPIWRVAWWIAALGLAALVWRAWAEALDRLSGTMR